MFMPRHIKTAPMADEVILLLGGMMTVAPALRAQQKPTPVIGFLGAASPQGWRLWVDAFLQRLHELGWIEGRNVAIEYRWAEGRSERYAEIAAEFVRMKVNVIVTVGSAVAQAKRATAAIPIVFAVANDPVGSGLVASLARPGGNVTGVSNETTDLAGKQVQFLHEAVPALRRLAVMANIGYHGAAQQMEEVQAAARTLGIEVLRLEIRHADDIAPAVEALEGRADALYVSPDALVAANRTRISAVALSAHLPTMSPTAENTQVGFLMSYGPDYPHLWRRAADYVDKILKGAEPADLPVEQPTRFQLVVNLKTAKSLGLTIPLSMLLLADEVIE
jgi:putative ABC transport system substrate-binding protein